MKIEIERLSKHFGSTRAVDDCSFWFESGQTVGFIGPNGAGKTTTMRILATLDEPTDGDARIDGMSVVQEPEKARKLVGFMPDSLPTHRDISVHDYLDFFARAYGIKSPARASVVESVEGFTNLAGIRRKTLRSLSKGMKQRVSLARAIVHDPPVLILDEPAAGLDPRARIELRELLKVLTDQGKAVLISSHILTELAEICDGAVIIEQGKILRAGRVHDLTTHEADTQVYVIRPVGDPQTLLRYLLESPKIDNAQILDGQVAFEFEGDEASWADTLAVILASGHRIVECQKRRVGLEELFMNLTEGRVQ